MAARGGTAAPRLQKRPYSPLRGQQRQQQRQQHSKQQQQRGWLCARPHASNSSNSSSGGGNSGAFPSDAEYAREMRNAAATLARRQASRQMELAALLDTIDRCSRRRIEREHAKPVEQYTPFEREWRLPNRFELEGQELAQARLARFWQQQGLARGSAVQLARWMVQMHSPYALDFHLLKAKLERLQRALPRPVNVAHALTQAPALIHQDVSGLVAACVALSQTFAPAQLPLLLKEEPKLLMLTAEEIAERITVSIQRLEQLFVEEAPPQLVNALAKFPGLLFQLPSLNPEELQQIHAQMKERHLQIYHLSEHLQAQKRTS